MIQRAARNLLGGAAAAFDYAVNMAALSRTGGQKQANTLGHEERIAILGRLRERYEVTGAAAGFFRDPRPIEPRQNVRLEAGDGLRVIDLSWPSDYETFLSEVQHVYDEGVENRTAAARLVLHDEPRPVAILVHGYLGGVHRTERRVWPMRFIQRIGMDAVLFVLPFHGPRAAPRRFGGRPPFPGADPRITNEGFRQAMGDLRDLIRWLFERGHPKVGIMGMSLGGFTAALAATVEPALSFAVPIIPLASIADTARRNRKLGTTPREVEMQYQALDAVYRITSPLHRLAVIPPSSILVIGGEQDQITPVSHARKLAAHFGCRIETWHGGHLMQFGRADKFRSVGRFLNELGVVSRRAAEGGG